MPRFADPPPSRDAPAHDLEAQLSAARTQIERLARDRDRLTGALTSARDRIVALEQVLQSRDQQERTEVEDSRQLERDHAREMTIARGVIETLECQCERADARAAAYRADLETEQQKTNALRRQVAELAGTRRRNSTSKRSAPAPSLETNQRPTVELSAIL